MVIIFCHSEMECSFWQSQMSSGSSERFRREDSKIRRSHTERQQESIDALLKCVTQNLGFSQEKPVAAFTIYKCLLHWKSFEAESTSVFDRLIQIIGSTLEVTCLFKKSNTWYNLK
ncbi:hypothetical protein DITRI_Ditri17bG0043000 [Diplodiscus trichospermus]